MNTLVAGNSHMVGFKTAAESISATLTYIPIPLCQNFEEAVMSETGCFELGAGWGNMGSTIGAKHINVRYDFSKSSKKLIFVGMKLYGCFPIFLPLLSANNERSFFICPGSGSVAIPDHKKYQLVSESCLTQIFLNELIAGIANYSWLFEKFDKVWWVPSPPPSHQFAEVRFLREHNWYIRAGLQVRFLSIFNKCLDQVNKSDVARSAGVNFLRHPMNCIDPQTGFLLPEFSFNQSIPVDIHASGKYYEQFVHEAIEDRN